MPRSRTGKTRLLLVVSGFLILTLFPGRAFPYNWLQFNGDPQHSGNNSLERTITGENVGQLRELFTVRLPATADGAPVYLGGVKTPGGVRDLLFVTAKTGRIIALDAKNGALVWQRSNPSGNCRINRGSLPCYTTSSPAIDPDLRYVYSYGLDGYVHKYRVQNGSEVRGGGWPEPATRKPFDEKGSSALAIATAKNGISYLYVANSGYLGDRGDYQGHLTTINLADGSQKVFNTLCSNRPVHFAETPESPDCPARRSGVWARAGVVYSPKTDRIYFTTGNAPFSPPRFDWGDSVLALHPDGTGKNGAPVDSYTPRNFHLLEEADLDLGSTAPAILFSSNLAVQSGKDGKLHLLDLENLSGRGGPGHVGGAATIELPQGGPVFSAPASWIDPKDGAAWIFLANSRGLSALELTPAGEKHAPQLKVLWRTKTGGTSPLLANGVLFCARSGTIRALDPETGRVLWKNVGIGPIHWESPVVANGVLYITDETGSLHAYSLKGLPPK